MPSVRNAKNLNLLKLPRFDLIKRLHTNGYLDTVYQELVDQQRCIQASKETDSDHSDCENELASTDVYFSVVYHQHKPVAIAACMDYSWELPYLMVYVQKKFRGKGYGVLATQSVVKYSQLPRRRGFRFYSSAMAALIVKAGFKLAEASGIHDDF